jgi:hypothetical protein
VRRLAPAEILGEVRQISPDCIRIDRMGIEVGIVSLDHAFVVKMLGIGDGLQIGLVTLSSADMRMRGFRLFHH